MNIIAIVCVIFGMSDVAQEIRIDLDDKINPAMSYEDARAGCEALGARHIRIIRSTDGYVKQGEWL